MYKQKLHEFCQQRKWSLPKYTTTKHGFDHTPHFRSSVSVDGRTFDSLSASKTSKESQNDAAKIAFLHFTCSSTDDQDSKWEYKRQLENYAIWKHGCSPLYQSVTEGTSHAPEYRSTVIIEGHAFECEKSFTKLNEAENALAEFVLLSIAEDSEEDYPIFYKNLLQEVARKECLTSPVYSTLKTGAPHLPTFYSSVEMEGERFYGKAAKSKKAAEASAAKVAFSCFEEKIRRAVLFPAISETDEVDTSDTFELNTTVNGDCNVENGYAFLSQSTSPFNDDEWVPVTD